MMLTGPNRLALFLCLGMPGLAFSAVRMEKTSNCGFGLFAFCLWDTPSAEGSSTAWRSEVFSGFKPGMRYYEEEAQNCKDASSCTFQDSGAVFGADLYRNINGNNRTADYVDVGLQYSQMPVADWKSAEAFRGSLDNAIEAGEGSLRYHFVRFAVKRSQFLGFLHSKYLISSFGVGLGIPEATGVARDFVGARHPVPSLGGKLGFQIPIHPSIDLGLASNWNVLWYGKSMSDSAFMAGYGLNLSARI